MSAIAAPNNNALAVQPQPHGFGAAVTGVDLSARLTAEIVADLRHLWLTYQVIYFPEQPLTHRQLMRTAGYFGEFGEDPYVTHVRGHRHILEVRREADEQVTPFGASWHSDWSFQAEPPSATLLHAKIVPPYGGNTLFADGYRAYETLDPVLREEVDELECLHSARRPYSHEGYERSGGKLRSMRIRPSDGAWATQAHPLVRTHPETGRRTLWINPVYTIAVKDMAHQASEALLQRLFEHALQPRFIYAHQWSADMLTIWDNRCVTHCAQGGYDGHRRVMHRCIVAGDKPV